MTHVEVWTASGGVIQMRVARGSRWDRASAWARYAATCRPLMWQRAPGDVVVDARGPAAGRPAGAKEVS